MRTEEEKASNDAIEATLLAYRDAYAAAHPEARVGTLTDWIVVAAELVPGDDPDDDETAYSVIMPNGGIPGYKAEGLLRMGIRYIGGGGDSE